LLNEDAKDKRIVFLLGESGWRSSEMLTMFKDEENEWSRGR
jgi:hypothetical protein